MKRLLLIASLLPISFALAETINLGTGQQVEGVVEKRTGDEIVVRTAGGRITYKDGRIRSFELSGKNMPAAGGGEVAGLRMSKPAAGGSREQPREFEGTYGELTALDRARESTLRLREQSIRAKASLPGLEQRRKALQASLDKEHKILDAIWRNPYAPGKYNAQVARVNQLKGELDAVDGAILRGEQLEDQALSQEAAYAERIRAFNEKFEGRKSAFAAAHPGVDIKPYLDRIVGRLARHQKTLSIDRPAYSRVGSHAVFEVHSRDKGPVKLMLDTGATYVAMNRDAAKRLGLPTAGIKTQLQLGNGKLMTGERVLAPELRVGNSVAKSVEVVVTEVTDAMEGMDGVLGMSFLRNFTVTYDPAAGVFELQSVKDGAR